jgi:hypothetical protein
VRNYSAIFVAFGAVAFVAAIVLGDFPLMAGGQPVLPDYLAHWTGGRMLLDGHAAALFDPAVQTALQHRLVGSGGLSWFVSPPYTAWIYLPLALLPYGASAVVWLLLDGALLALALAWTRRLAAGRLRDGWGLFVLAFCASPGVFEAVGSGQDSILALALWVAGLRLLLGGRDLGAGAVLALGIFKPQLFVLVPVLLVAQRRWRALAGFVGVAGTIVAVSVLVDGLAVWRDWVGALTSPLYAQEVQSGQLWKMQSLSALLEVFVPGGVVGFALLAAGALGLLVLGRQPGDRLERDWSVLALVTVVTSPHVVLYDVVLLLPALVWVFSHLDWRAVRGPVLAIFVLQWCIPLLHVAALQLGSDAVDAPWTAVPLTVLLLRVWRSRHQDPVPVPSLTR